MLEDLDIINFGISDRLSRFQPNTKPCLKKIIEEIRSDLNKKGLETEPLHSWEDPTTNNFFYRLKFNKPINDEFAENLAIRIENELKKRGIKAYLDKNEYIIQKKKKDISRMFVYYFDIQF